MGYLDTTVSTTGGVAFDLNGGSGVASKVNVSSAFIVAAGTVTPGAQMVALSTAPTVNTVLTIAVQIQGIIVFSSPGSLVLRFAQSSAAGTTTLNPYSFLRLEALDAEITA